MKASPASTFIVIEAEFLLELLIVALDPPAQFGRLHKARERRIGWQSGKPIFDRCAFALRPFDEQPFSGVGLRAPVISMRRMNAQAGETGAERLVDAFTPCDLTPGAGRQRLGDLLGGLRLVVRVTPHQRRRPTLPAPCLGRERAGAGRPQPRRRGAASASNPDAQDER